MTTAVLAALCGVLCWLILWLKDQRQQVHGGVKHREQMEQLNHSDHSDHLNMLTDYTVYRLSGRERTTSMVAAGAVFAVTGYLFYAHAAAVAVGLLIGAVYPRVTRKALNERRLQTLRVQFKQALQGVASSLGAGKSVEQAFADAVYDLKLVYPEGTCHMLGELEIMLRKLQNGETIESAIADFSRRSGMDDAQQFAEVFTVSKRTGGNLIEIVRRTSSLISEKLQIEQDIAVLLAQKKFEARILLGSPVAIVAVLKMTAAEYMEPLYFGGGRWIMTGALLLLGCCFWLTQRLMDVRV